MTKQQLDEIKQRVEAATEGPGYVNFCPVNAETEGKIKEMMTVAIDFSKDHDGGHDFHWISAGDDRIIAFFGNGPTSGANAQLWAEARNSIPALLAHIESLEGQLVEARDVILHYAGNFNGKEGTRWNGDTFFLEDKFGHTESIDGEERARAYLEKYPNHSETPNS